jgi:hypothetical protein
MEDRVFKEEVDNEKGEPAEKCLPLDYLKELTCFL